MKRKHERLFTFFAWFFLILWIVDGIHKLQFVNEHLYFWFCSSTLLLLIAGLFERNNDMISGFLALSLLFQVIWIIDYVVLSFGFDKIFGFAEYVFEPNMGLFAFVLVLRHFLMIPVAIWAMFVLPKRPRQGHVVVTVSIFLACMITYIFTTTNVNCVRESCIEGLSLPLYPISFLLATSLLCGLVIYPILLLLYDVYYRHKHYKSVFKKIFFIVILLFFVIALMGVFKYASLPHDTCEVEGEHIRCFGAQTSLDDYYLLRVYNPKQCVVEVYIDDVYVTEGFAWTDVDLEQTYFHLEPVDYDRTILLIEKC